MPMLILLILSLILSACAPHGWRQYVAADGTDQGVEAAYLHCRDTGPYANTVRLAYAFEYETSQYDCMRDNGFRLRR